MPSTEEKVKHIITDALGINEDDIADTSSFEDLGVDSLDSIEFIMSFEEEFGITIPDEEAEKILTVKQAIDYIEAHKP